MSSHGKVVDLDEGKSPELMKFIFMIHFKFHFISR